MKVMLTGAYGFIGSALCRRLAVGNTLIGIDCGGDFSSPKDFLTKQTDLTDFSEVEQLCKEHTPDVVIHCAGIAHQKIGTIDSAAYMRVNSEATENLARRASEANPDVSFIFLSSISVYGEDPHPGGIRSAVTSEFHRAGITQITRIKQKKTKNDAGVDEEGECRPSSDYAASKLDAERRLIALFDAGKLDNLTILRLAPVYDREWSLNLDRRVFAPGKLAYLRFGSGMQRMSALGRPNLVDFIEFLVHRFHRFSQIKKNVSRKDAKTLSGEGYPHVSVVENNPSNRCNLRMNVCDAEPYEFNRIIEVFKKSGIHPNRPVILVPLFPVWVATRVAGTFFPGKKSWFHSCYDKLASDLVFDNTRMLETGFVPRHSLETIFFSGAKKTGLATDAHRLTQTSTD